MRVIFKVSILLMLLVAFVQFVVLPGQKKQVEDSLKCRVIYVDTLKRIPLVEGPTVGNQLIDIPQRVCYWCEDQKVHCKDDEEF